jgi:prepilin-type processing-associated H-X9-DG protein
MYADAHGGRYPDRLEDLFLHGATGADQIELDVLVCPSSQDERATGATPEEAARQLAEPGHQSYVYAGGGMNRTGSDDVVLAYDRPVNHPGGAGMNVLYGDGHVEFATRRVAEWLTAEIATGHNPPRVQQAE